MTELVTVPGGNRWRVGETEFVYGFRGQSTENRLLIQKTPDLIDRYVAICEEFRHGAIFELGIAGGGSTASSVCSQSRASSLRASSTRNRSPG